MSASIRVASALSSLFVAGILLFTGAIHAAQPYFFVHTIASYRILPAWLAGLVGIWLPYGQIVLALCIGCRIAERSALKVAAIVFITFALAQMAVLIRGMDIDCGCFGFVARTVTAQSVTIPIILTVTCFLAAVSGGGAEESMQCEPVTR